jgi:hypothetical protein
MAGVIALLPGSQLQLSDLDMSNFANKSDYVYSPATPYQSVASGISIWPSISAAPNSTFLGSNITGSYYNPSDSDDCQRYVEKTLAFLTQVRASYDRSYDPIGFAGVHMLSYTCVTHSSWLPACLSQTQGYC